MPTYRRNLQSIPNYQANIQTEPIAQAVLLQPDSKPTYQRSEEDNKAYALIDLSKIYYHEQNYEGSPDEFFDDKYATFIENCNTVGLSKTRHHEAFHMMLKGAALQHCRTIIQQNKSIIPPLDKLVIAMKEFFEGKERESMIRN